MLPFGEYTLVEMQPGGYLDSIDTAGSKGGTAAAVGGDRISQIALAMGDVATRYDFSEVAVTPWSPPEDPPHYDLATGLAELLLGVAGRVAGQGPRHLDGDPLETPTRLAVPRRRHRVLDIHQAGHARGLLVARERIVSEEADVELLVEHLAAVDHPHLTEQQQGVEHGGEGFDGPARAAVRDLQGPRLIAPHADHL